MNVLIIDDDPVIQEILWAVVRKAFEPGNPITVHNLEDALRWLARHKLPDLALLDLLLPGHAGLESLTLFRSKFAGVRVIVVSVVEDPEFIRLALDAGAVGYIPKSTPVPEMVAALKHVASGGIYSPPAK